MTDSEFEDEADAQDVAVDIGCACSIYIDAREKLEKILNAGLAKFPDCEEIVEIKNWIEKDPDIKIKEKNVGTNKDEKVIHNEGGNNATGVDGAEAKVNPSNNNKTDCGKAVADVDLGLSPSWTHILTPGTCDRLEHSALLEISSEKQKFRDPSVIHNISEDLSNIRSVDHKGFQDNLLAIVVSETVGRKPDEVDSDGHNAYCKTPIVKKATFVTYSESVKRIMEKLNEMDHTSEKKWKANPVAKKKMFENYKDNDSDENHTKLPKDKETNFVLGKRVSRHGEYQKSPFIKRSVDIWKRLTVVENNVFECIFAGIKGEYNVLFENVYGLCIPRVVLESLSPGIQVHARVIDVWAHVMNYEERYRDPTRSGRIFGTTGVMTTNMLDTEMYFTDNFGIFKSDMDGILGTVEKSITEADLILFPIIKGSHYYLVCFDLKKMVCDVIDNMNYIDPAAQDYIVVLKNLNELMMYYLASKHHPKN